MFKKMAIKITTILVDNNLINIKEYHIYSYGFEVIIASFINIIFALSLSLIFHKFIHVLIFLICYSSIRQFSGGYHANNHKSCIFIFLIIVLITIYASNYINTVKHFPIIIIFLLLNYFSILFLAPLEHKNNPLSLDEKKRYSKISKLLVTIILFIVIISFVSRTKTDYTLFCLSALFWINIMLILGNLQMRRDKNEQIFIKDT
ncbi:TPA: accessory gene regulator B family protein [Clostridioides difficile]|nr:accessory gene regulator B family protein [Clostridioides difficile]MDW0092583.1 accessory gene regulator B family protein [Clostridioides difficile]HBF4443216.1 accessory gene regulator B family protein [Clostridioides difficile]HBG1420750.1 accessory gene regulator B family protein [Clostridioides difficile]HDF2797377.1 accessory gene regulator B family protein [Clostridioides difficile]